MSAQFPACQHMCSHSTIKEVFDKHASHLKTFNATIEDCRVVAIKEVPEWDVSAKRDGLNTRYTLEWTTYKGWRVYMLHSGCFAYDPKYETE